MENPIMTDFVLSAAKTFLEKWAVDKFELASPDEALDMLVELAAMVDREYADCSPDSEKKCQQKHFDRNEIHDNIDDELKEAIIDIKKKRVALWVILLQGMKTAILVKAPPCNALNGLLDELIGHVRGVSDKTAFDIPRKSRVLDIDKTWLRAQVIVVLENHPERRKEIIINAEWLLGIYEPAVSRMVDNFKNGREPREDFTNLVKTARMFFPLIIDDRLL